MTHVHTTKKAVFVFITVALLTFILPILTVPIEVNDVLGATSVFYSILLGFYIASAMTNLSRLKSLVAMETGALISIYHLAKLALPDKADQMRKSIDRYLVKRFDYELGDYTEPTTKEFFSIFDVLKGAEPTSAGESSAMNYIAEAQYYIAQARRELSIVGAKIVTTASWVVLIALSMIIVATLFLMRDGTFANNIVTIFLSSSAIIALFILNDVDGNKFGEEEFAIDTYQAVFKALELDPYYPEHYIVTERHIPKDSRYRTGSSKEIKVIEKEPS